jgi:hypothetical protein
MPEMTLSFLKGDKVDSNVDYRDQLPENMTGIPRPILGVQGYMLQQPGLTNFGTGVGNDRGGVWNERQQAHYRLSGNQFIEVDTSGVSTSLGTINGILNCSLPYSFNTQAIIAEGNYYLYDPVGGFRQVLDPEVGNPIDAIWVDGYYFFTDGENLYHTNILNEEEIDPLTFATAEFSPDPTVGLGKTTDNKVIAFNRYSIEYFVNQANVNFAFTRLSQRAVKYGLVATYLKAEIGGTWYFVGGPKEGSLSVYRLETGRPTEIASREITQLLQVYSEADLADAVMEARIYEGIEALIIHLPNETLFFNLTLAAAVGKDQAWSTLSSPSANQWRAIHGIYDQRIDEWVYGDQVTSTLGALDMSVATQYGDKISCSLNTPFVYLETTSIDELDVQTIPGFNTVDDSTIFLSMSYDGVLWGNEEPISNGAPGQYGAHWIAYRLGYVDDFVTFRLRWVTESRMAFSRTTIIYG